MLAFLFYINLFHSSVATEAPCNISKPVGANIIIPIFFKDLKHADHLKWMHGNDRVYYRKDNVTKDEKLKITSDGSLIIDHFKLSDSGKYEVTIHDAHGTHLYNSFQHLCVLDPSIEVPDALKKPEVKYSCAGQWPVLKCEHGDSAEINVIWHRNGNTTGQNHSTLTLNPDLFKAGDAYSCIVKNQVSEQKSSQVKPVCSDVADQSTKLFGLDLWLMVVIWAGGGLVILLLILSIVCCLCKRKKTKEKEIELRLANLTNTPDDQSDQTPLKKPRRERGPLPEIPKPRVRPPQLLSNSDNRCPDMVINSQYMHMR